MRKQFIFTRKNRWLKNYYQSWKKHEKYGTYVLIGASGSGKSLFLKQLVKELEGECCIYTGQEIESLLLKHVRENKKVELTTAPVMIFEDIDCLIKNDAMRNLFETVIHYYLLDENGKERLILMTAVDIMAFQLDGYSIPVNPLRVNWKLVRLKAKEQQVKLSLREMLVLSRCKRVSELEAKIRKIKMIKEM